MIKLVTFPAAFGLTTLTPFGEKLVAYLKMAGLPFEIVYQLTPRGAPKGKLPLIVDDDGATLADSGFIVDHLEKKRADPFDRALDARGRAEGHLLRRTIEESLYWIIVYSRWADDANWPAFKKEVFASIPAPIRAVVPAIPRRMTLKQLHAQGTGRHAKDEVYAIGSRDVDAIAGILGDRPFMLGDAPTTVDATAYGFLHHLMDAPFESPTKARALEHANLRAYLERFRSRFIAG